MKQIIVPTDFSENALKAAQFALSLSEDIQADLLIVHAYLPFQSSFQSDKTNLSDSQRAREEAEKEMAVFIQKFTAGRPDSAIHFEVKEGTLLSVVQALNDADKNTIVVMGTTGASGMKKLIGSNTLFIANNTALPLLTVPANTTQFTIRNVAFFTDFKPRDKENIQSLISFLGKEKVRYHVLHIQEKGEDYDQVLTRLKNWTSELQQITGLHTLNYELLNSANDAKLVKQISERNDIDLLSLTLQEMNFWDNLFEKNLAKEIILQSSTPVFIQH